MTALELYKFVQDKEMDWRGDGHLKLWLEGGELKEFAEIEGDGITEDGGFEVYLVGGGTICIDLDEVCELHDINPEDILAKKD
ncbi:hypothetical protein ACDX78_13565 [Virgibacillus oceani]